MKIYGSKQRQANASQTRNSLEMELKAQNDSLRKTNKALVLEVEFTRNKSKATSKRHEHDLCNLRKGIDLLHKGLQKRSEENVELLAKVDASLERMEDTAFSSHADEQSEEVKALVVFRQLIPQARQDLLELRKKLDIEKQQEQPELQAPSPSAQQAPAEEAVGASPKGEKRERDILSPTLNSPSATEMLLSEYRSALANANEEIQNLRGQLGSCLNEKSNLRQELDERMREMELKEEEESSQVASAHASEALALKSMHLLESRVSELAAGKESSEKQVAILKSQLVDMERKLLNSKDQVSQLCQDNESLSAFGVKQQNEIDELKHLISVQKKDIRAALAVMKSFQRLPPQHFSGEPESDEQGAEDLEEDAFMMMEQEENSSVLDEFEQEISHLGEELHKLEKAIS